MLFLKIGLSYHEIGFGVLVKRGECLELVSSFVLKNGLLPCGHFLVGRTNDATINQVLSFVVKIMASVIFVPKLARISAEFAHICSRKG